MLGILCAFPLFQVLGHICLAKKCDRSKLNGTILLFVKDSCNHSCQITIWTPPMLLIDVFICILVELLCIISRSNDQCSSVWPEIGLITIVTMETCCVVTHYCYSWTTRGLFPLFSSIWLRHHLVPYLNLVIVFMIMYTIVLFKLLFSF